MCVHVCTYAHYNDKPFFVEEILCGKNHKIQQIKTKKR